VPNVSTTRVVHPAEWYISPALIDNAATKKYSSILVLRLEPDSDMADLEHICEFIESNVHVWVRVKLLNDNAFLLYTVLIRIILYATV
jgi:16S rRNA C967 or C1407 C5-methylase (RsmB/RsmF family)